MLRSRALRIFNTIRLHSSKPDWMRQAELDAQASSKLKVMSSGSPTDIIMGRIVHDLEHERITNTTKLEMKLMQLILTVNNLRADSSSSSLLASQYNEARKLAIDARQSLIVQREVSGIEARADSQTTVLAFPIPPPATS